MITEFTENEILFIIILNLKIIFLLGRVKRRNQKKAAGGGASAEAEEE